MVYSKSLGFVCVAAMVSACGVETGLQVGASEVESVGQNYVGGHATESEAQADILSLVSDVDDVFNTQGVTPYATMPTGSATYSGVVTGEHRDDGSITYAADMRLQVNFDNDSVYGDIRNFLTNVDGFGQPTGTIPLTGLVSDVGGDATIEINGMGTLAQGSISATHSMQSEYGYFGGPEADAIAGGHDAEFNWVGGDLDGDTSPMVGGFVASRD